MSKEAMTLALEALEICNGAETADGVIIYTNAEINALDKAIAEAEKQEQCGPVGYVWQEWTKENSPYGIEQWVRKYDYFPPNSEIKQVREVTPLYTTPQPAQKPLTDEQIEAIHQSTWMQSTATLNDFARAIEAAHGIKS